MKKLMMALTIGVVACSVHAAALNWSLTNIATPADSSVKASGVMAYLFMSSQTVASTTGDNFGVANTTTDAAIAALTGGTFADFATTYAAASKTSNTAGGVSGATGYYGSFGAGDALTAFAVIIDTDDPTSFSNYIITSEASASWTSATGTKNLAFGSQAAATWTAVPEPTSGLLMLLGMAGLALKRKRA